MMFDDAPGPHSPNHFVVHTLYALGVEIDHAVEIVTNPHTMTVMLAADVAEALRALTIRLSEATDLASLRAATLIAQKDAPV